MTLISRNQRTDQAIMKPMTSSIWIPIQLIGFVAVCVSALAVVVVLSLIPTFLGPKYVVVDKDVFLVNIIYKTDLFNGSSLSLNNLNQLIANVKNALDLNQIDSLNAQFISSDPCVINMKNAPSLFSKLNGDHSVGDLFNLNLIVQYPNYCPSDTCQQRFFDKTLKSISIEHANLTLPMSFSNGILSNVKLSFCSFNNYNKCMVNNGICDACDVCGDDEEDEEEIEDDDETCEADCDDEE